MLFLLLLFVCGGTNAGHTDGNTELNVFGGLTYFSSENDEMFYRDSFEIGINALKNWGDWYVKAQASTRPELENELAIDWLYAGRIVNDKFNVEAGWLDTPMGYQSRGIHNPFSRYSILPASTTATISKGFANLVEGFGTRVHYNGFDITYRVGKPKFSPPSTRFLMEAAVIEFDELYQLDWDLKHSVNIDYNKWKWDFRLSLDTITYNVRLPDADEKRWTQFVIATKREGLKSDSVIEMTVINAEPVTEADVNLKLHRSQVQQFSRGSVFGLYLYHGVEVYERVMVYGAIDLMYFDHKSRHGDWYESIEHKAVVYPKELRFTEDFAIGIKYYIEDNWVLSAEYHKTRGALSNKYNYWGEWVGNEMAEEYPDNFWDTTMFNISFVF